ncbi:MAG: SH3 domain-containing protein [Anaerolineae bacterium]|nr:SH3 domain-containing protein [Anaerolineae bacterium]
MVILQVIIGAVFALLFGINSILRTARGREKVSFFETLVAFLALVFPVLALVSNNNSTQPLRMVNMAAIGLGVLVIVIGLITFLVERGKAARPVAQRRSVLAVGIGVLLVAATFVVPVAAKLPTLAGRNQAANVPASGNTVNVSEVASPNAVVNSPTPTEQIVVVPTRTVDAAMLQLSATPTRLASPMPTATNTPFVIATTTAGSVTDGIQPTGTVQSAAAQITGCTVIPRQNVNLRSGPGSTNELLMTIPFSTTLNASAKTKTGDWWYVSYQNKNGWVSADYVNASADCSHLPIKAE